MGSISRRFNALSFAVAFGLLLPQSSAWAGSLRASDRAFSLDLPGEWVAGETDSAAVVLQVENDHAEITVRTLPTPLAETQLKTRLRSTQAKLKKSGVTARKIYTIAATSGVRIYFVEFVSEGRRYQSGYFNLGGRTYSFLAADLTAKEFKAIPASLAPLAAEEPPAPAAEASQQAQSAVSPLSAPPDPASGALAAPPQETLPAEGMAPEAPAELPALPDRNVGGSLMLVLIAVAISAAALGYRALAKKDQEMADAPPVPGSLFPLHIEKRYLAFNTVFDIKDAAGQEYRAVSPRIPTLLLGTGLILYFLLKASVQGILFFGVDLQTLPLAVLQPISSLLSLSNLLIMVGAVLFLFFRKKMKLYDASGNLLLDVCQKVFSFGSQYFMIRDAAGVEGARLKRVGFVLIRRRWQLLDLQGNVMLDIQEDSAARAIARKFFGHLWGLLRTNYVVSAGGAEIGAIKREWSIWNRYNLGLAPDTKLNPELALAAALFVDIADPDRWHPWHG